MDIFHLADRIQNRMEQEVRITVPGHTQRGGEPCAYDRVIATRLGAEAGNAILRGEYGFMVGLCHDEIIHVPLEDVAGKLKYVDPDSEIIAEARSIGISFGERCDLGLEEEDEVIIVADEKTKKEKKSKKEKKDKE